MPTNRNRRTRKSAKPIIPKALIYYFETGDEDQSGFDERDRYNVFLIDFPLGKGNDIDDLWELCRKELLNEWIKKNPVTRPFAWWRFDSPETQRTAESEAAYLQRHGLLNEVEKRHLKKHPELLEPERITLDFAKTKEAGG